MCVITIENLHIYSRVCTTFEYCLKYVYIFLCQISIVTKKIEDQRVTEKPNIEARQTIQWPKEKETMIYKPLQIKLKIEQHDPTKTGVYLKRSLRVISSGSTSSNHSVTIKRYTYLCHMEIMWTPVCVNINICK
jgi:hypothetical protein